MPEFTDAPGWPGRPEVETLSTGDTDRSDVGT